MAVDLLSTTPAAGSHNVQASIAAPLVVTLQGEVRALKAENAKLKALLAAHEMAKTMTPGKIEHPFARVLEYVRETEEVEINAEAERVAVQAILENICGV